MCKQKGLFFIPCKTFKVFGTTTTKLWNYALLCTNLSLTKIWVGLLLKCVGRYKCTLYGTHDAWCAFIMHGMLFTFHTPPPYSMITPSVLTTISSRRMCFGVARPASWRCWLACCKLRGICCFFSFSPLVLTCHRRQWIRWHSSRFDGEDCSCWWGSSFLWIGSCFGPDSGGENFWLALSLRSWRRPEHGKRARLKLQQQDVADCGCFQCHEPAEHREVWEDRPTCHCQICRLVLNYSTFISQRSGMRSIIVLCRVCGVVSMLNVGRWFNLLCTAFCENSGPWWS